MADPRELLSEGRRCQQMGALERAVDCFREAIEQSSDPVVASEGWRRMSSVRRAQCRWDEALEAAHRARQLARRANDPDAVAESLNAEAAIHMNRGEMAVARPLLEEAAEVSSSDRAMGITLQNLGFVAARTGDLDAAERYFEVSAAHFRRAGYRWGEACVLNSHAGAALDRGDHRLAASTAERAIEAAREVEDLNLLALATQNRAEALAKLGDLSTAEDLLSEALGYFGAAGDHMRQVDVFKLLGDISVKRGDPVTARRCFEKGLELAKLIEVRLESKELTDRLGGLADVAVPPVPQAPARRAPVAGSGEDLRTA